MNEMLKEMGEKATKSATVLRKATTEKKNQALLAMGKALYTHEKTILEANQKDVLQAQENNLTTPMIERLTLTKSRIQAMVESIHEIVDLPDPVGLLEEMSIATENGLQIAKQRVPLGVIGIIYESRPNVTSDAAAICFKSGNAVILRGGKEALASNQAILEALQEGLESAGLPKEALQLIPDPSRELATAFMQMNDYLDCLIPRGGASLIRTVMKNATVPVIETGVGNCHLYIDQAADLDMATRILVNAKCDRPSVCNAVETLLVHEAVAADYLPVFAKALQPFDVEIRGDKKTCEIISSAILATEEDYDTEFLDFILAVKTVENYEEAISHIEKHSTGHSEVIVTDDLRTSQNFLQDIDAAAVYVNASSRFTDGGCFGLGGEIGISTQKLHARGPMGLKELTSYKYIIRGEGEIRGTTGSKDGDEKE